MPELPEVETIKLGLQTKIVGKTFKRIQILNPKSFQGDPQKILNKKILSVSRKAKMLIIDLEGELSLVFHLKMSGQIVLVEGKRVKEKSERFVGGHPTKDMLGNLPNNSTRVIFDFSKNNLKDKPLTLYFNDQRKFGWVKLIHDEETKKLIDETFKKLGPEPLDKSFSWRNLQQRLSQHKNLPVKVAILDQQTISGIGNIYACEALFLAKIHPKRRVKEIRDEEIKRLRNGIVASLKSGIRFGGSTRTHFVNAEGKKGLYLDYAFVYNRKGLPCKVCGTTIEKIRIGGRGTLYCPGCQE